MKKGIFFLLLLLVKPLNAQINFQDSSAQVISYWEVGEKYEYAIKLQKLKYTETDTISIETMTYDVEVSVIDSSQSSYIVQWLYKNFNSDSKNPIVQKIASAAEDVIVKIELDELGIIQAVKNWEEVRDYMLKSFNNIRKDFEQMPEIQKVFEQA